MRHLSAEDRFKRYGRKTGLGKFFLEFAGCFWELKWAIGIDENNTFLSQFLF